MKTIKKQPAHQVHFHCKQSIYILIASPKNKFTNQEKNEFRCFEAWVHGRMFAVNSTQNSELVSFVPESRLPYQSVPLTEKRSQRPETG